MMGRRYKRMDRPWKEILSKVKYKEEWIKKGLQIMFGAPMVK